MEVDPKVRAYLHQFREFNKLSPGPIPDSITIRGARSHGPHLVFGAIIHGNETGSLPAMLHVVEMLLQNRGITPFQGSVTFFLGNVPACEQGVRFREADLNRVFCPQLVQTWESKRAQEIMGLLEQASLFVDFHQTSEPCRMPFYIFGFDLASYHWARALGGTSALVTRDSQVKFEEGSLCGDEWVRSRGVPAVTLELGQKGLRKDAEYLCESMIWRSLLLGFWIWEKEVSLEFLAQQNQELEFFTITKRVPFTHPLAHLHPGLQNFAPIQEGQILGLDGKGIPIPAPASGYALFPKYPDRDETGAALPPLSGDLVQIVTEISKPEGTLIPDFKGVRLGVEPG